MTTPAEILDDELLLPEQQPPELPEGCPLSKLYKKRVAQNRDLTILVSDWNLERGTGKTTLALKLAAAMDRTDDGITTEKTTLSAQQLEHAYTDLPKQSGLVLDEGQAAVSNRRAMSGINEAMRKIVGMGRVEEKYLIMSSPGVHQVDKDIRNMCDIWLFCTSLGSAEMYRVKYDPFSNNELTDHWGTLNWGGELPGSLQHVYDDLTVQKKKALRGDDDSDDGFVPAGEVREKLDSAREEAKQQKRNEILQKFYENKEDMTQQDLADGVGLARSTIANILSSG